ncbi:MAG: M48 family metallopeptidase [Candidatus Bathyarchaeia archaeon]
MNKLNQNQTITIFGEPVQIKIQKAEQDGIEAQQNKITIKTSKIKPENILKEYLKTLLEEKATEVYNYIKKEGKIEIHGDIKFKVTEKIDNKRQRIAKLQGNTITLKINTVTLPEEALKYIIAHEIAHIYIKRHTKRFWQILEAIHPSYKQGKDILEKTKNMPNKLQNNHFKVLTT